MTRSRARGGAQAAAFVEFSSSSLTAAQVLVPLPAPPPSPTLTASTGALCVSPWCREAERDHERWSMGLVSQPAHAGAMLYL